MTGELRLAEGSLLERAEDSLSAEASSTTDPCPRPDEDEHVERDERVDGAAAELAEILSVVDEHDRADPDLDVWGTHAVRGTKGTEVWDEIAPQSTDRVVKKPSYSAFFGSELDIVLDELGVERSSSRGASWRSASSRPRRTRCSVASPSRSLRTDSQAGTSPLAEAAALGALQVMAPFGPAAARKARLDRTAQLAE